MRPLTRSQPTASPKEGAVEAAAVDEEPVSALAFQRAVSRASDEKLWVGLEGDLVHLRKAADRDALAGQRTVPSAAPDGPDDDDRALAGHGPSRCERDSIDRLSDVHGLDVVSRSTLGERAG